MNLNSAQSAAQKFVRTHLCIMVMLVFASAPVTLSVTVAQPTDTCPTVMPTTAASLLAAAEACLELEGRDAALALRYAQAALDARPANPRELARAYTLQAQAHFWLMQHGQALVRQTQALLIETTAERLLIRAELMDRVGDRVGAVADAQQAIALAPRQLAAYLWLARYALENGDEDLALTTLDLTTAFAADNAEIARLRGDAHYALADYAAAQASYERYLALADLPSAVVIARMQLIERRLAGS